MDLSPKVTIIRKSNAHRSESSSSKAVEDALRDGAGTSIVFFTDSDSGTMDMYSTLYEEERYKKYKSEYDKLDKLIARKAKEYNITTAFVYPREGIEQRKRHEKNEKVAYQPTRNESISRGAHGTKVHRLAAGTGERCPDSKNQNVVHPSGSTFVPKKKPKKCHCSRSTDRSEKKCPQHKTKKVKPAKCSCATSKEKLREIPVCSRSNESGCNVRPVKCAREKRRKKPAHHCSQITDRASESGCVVHPSTCKKPSKDCSKSEKSDNWCRRIIKKIKKSSKSDCSRIAKIEAEIQNIQSELCKVRQQFEPPNACKSFAKIGGRLQNMQKVICAMKADNQCSCESVQIMNKEELTNVDYICPPNDPYLALLSQPTRSSRSQSVESCRGSGTYVVGSSDSCGSSKTIWVEPRTDPCSSCSRSTKQRRGSKSDPCCSCSRSTKQRQGSKSEPGSSCSRSTKQRQRSNSFTKQNVVVQSGSTTCIKTLSPKGSCVLLCSRSSSRTSVCAQKPEKGCSKKVETCSDSSNQAARKSNSSCCMFCNKDLRPTPVSCIRTALEEKCKGLARKNICLTVVLRSDGLYHIGVMCIRTSKTLGCFFVTEQGLNEANKKRIFEDFLVIFVTEKGNTHEERKKITSYTFEFLND